MNYDEWIDKNYPDRESARNQCSIATTKMIKVFPELTRVRGWYGGIEHWWCKSPAGLIVDPTYRQFHSLSHLSGLLVSNIHYVEFREGIDPEVVGKCMNCGMEIWDKDPETFEPLEVYSTCICSKECDVSFRAYLECN